MSKRVVWSKMSIFEHLKTCGLVENVNFSTCQNVWFGWKCQFLNMSKRVVWSNISIFEHVKTCGLVENVNFEHVKTCGLVENVNS